MELTDIAWLAGIIDGEGCLSLIRVGDGEAYRAILFLDNSSAVIIENAERICRQLGAEPQRHTTRPSNRNEKSRLPIHRLHLTRGLSRVLTALLPYLVTEKRNFSEALIELQKLRPKPYTTWTEEHREIARQIRKRFMPRSKQT